ncbi:unnamed protein product [Psylliodes chrysocephalus]|uniref:Uncharacterized protein n=1 Tax=Psylliodes chrysocephalus TaxID=3402493 RepID=A0A9P0D299_9CUCU|nr:unnamed protein product [Psylliodes chrysocephala]
MDKCLTKFDFAPVFKIAVANQNLPEHIRKGFRRCGLFPFDCNTVDYTKCVQNSLENLQPTNPTIDKSQFLSSEDFQTTLKTLKMYENKNLIANNLNENEMATDISKDIGEDIEDLRIETEDNTEPKKTQLIELSAIDIDKTINEIQRTSIESNQEEIKEHENFQKITCRRQEFRNKQTIGRVDLDYGLLEQPDLEQEEHEKMENTLLIKLKLTDQQIVELEEKTKLQSTTSIWMEERKLRITNKI